MRGGLSLPEEMENSNLLKLTADQPTSFVIYSIVGKSKMQTLEKTINELARSITWTGSKQTYYTARLLVDKGLVNSFYQAYAYFRWMDDIIDNSTRSYDERISFIMRQRGLLDRLYNNEKPGNLKQEGEILKLLINHDRDQNSGLRSFIRNMFAIVEFDAYRKGRLINQEELAWYSNTLAKSVTDGLLYFVGNGHKPPDTNNQYLAAKAAHITHLLRDMLPDIAEGYINIPREYLEKHGISSEEVHSDPFREWVQSRVELAKEYFREGKQYLDNLDPTRRKIAGYWYCARFEGLLEIIEKDGYILRPKYYERRNLSTWLNIAWLGLSITFRERFSRYSLDI
jgi:phytoene/squalene synthetase